MFEFAAAEFDSLMNAYSSFRKQNDDPLVVGGSQVLGVEQLSYSDGRITVTFTSSAGSMQLTVRKTQKGQPQETLLNERFTDFGAVRETLKEQIGG